MLLVSAFVLGGASRGGVSTFLSRLNISFPDSQPTAVQTVVEKQPIYLPQTTQEEAVIKVVKDYSPAVVSVIISKNVPVYQRYFIDPFGGGSGFVIPQVQQQGTQLQQVGGGSGFIVSDTGLVLTNKHVVSDTAAEYTIFTNEGKKYQAQVVARDPVEDLAIIKIIGDANQKFPTVKLGDSSNVQIGQSVIAIGNALAQFDNTVSVGVVSGLRRTITAGGGGASETLSNLIQTDAAINEGNSGGPLLNLKGEVIGVNTAMAAGAQAIGFVIPINQAKRDIDQVTRTGKIVYPFLGVSYTIIDGQIQKENKLSVDYGAWVISSSNQASVVAGSPAAAAGVKDSDIILEINSEKITQDNTLAQILSKYSPQDKVTLKVLRGTQELTLSAILTERKQ